MDEKMFQKLMNRIIEFEKTHEKVENASKKELLDYYLLLYRVTANDEEECVIDRSENQVVVRIQSSEIIILDAAPALKNLVTLANTIFIRPKDSGVEIEMDFRLWDWKEKMGQN